MKLRRFISGELEGDGPLYAVVEIEFFGTRCTGCGELIRVGAPALFRVDDNCTRLDHPECRIRTAAV